VGNVERPESFANNARDIARRLFRHENFLLVIVLVGLVGGLSVITKGLTSTRTNMVNILLQSSMRGVATVGQTFVILSAGIDLSVGGVGLVCSVLGTGLMSLNPMKNIIGHPVPIYMVIPIMLLVASGWGAINGAAVSRGRLPALVVTLAMWEITKGVAFRISGGQSTGSQPESLAFFGSGVVAGVPVPVIIFVAVAVVSYLILNYTIFGRSIYAVGGSPTSAWLSGVNIKKIQFTAYLISAFLAGLAGVISSALFMSASMQSLSGLELDTIAAAFIGGISLMGGRGNLIGAVIGVLILGVINNGLSVLRFDPAIQGIVKGAIILAAVSIDYSRKRS
jgi:putative xylitol transport system permease protein